MKNKIINNNLSTISDCIVNFLWNEARYKAHSPAEFGIDADSSNVIYLMENSLPDGMKINIKSDCINNEIYIGTRNKMKGVNVTITGSGCALFIGDRCNLTTLNIGIVEDNDAVCIGHAVSVASKNMWTTGTHSGADGKAIIVGDDCMFSSDVAIRGSDGHPVLLIDDLSQTNIPRLPVVVEPHCWVGQGAFIQKCVTVGACSIIAAKSIVTKSAPRFSLLVGAPAQRKSIEGKIWARHLGENGILKAKLWADKYHVPAPEPEPEPVLTWQERLIKLMSSAKDSFFRKVLTLRDGMDTVYKVAVIVGVLAGVTFAADAMSAERPINYQQVEKMYQHYHGHYDVVMLGDSLTARGNWQDMFPDVRIGNRGIGGDDTQGMLSRLDAVVATGAKKVFIMAGTNDLNRHVNPEHVADNIMKIADVLSSKGITPVIQSTLYSGKDRKGKNPAIKQINEYLKTESGKKGYEFIDINKLIAPEGFISDELTIDGTHLTVKGYSVWLQAIKSHL